jgi:hypothetical protein
MTRPTNPSDPTAERTADQSTQTSGGLGGGREDEEIIPRTREERDSTPRQYEHEEDKALPSDDPTYRTEI